MGNYCKGFFKMVLTKKQLRLVMLVILLAVLLLLVGQTTQ